MDAAKAIRMSTNVPNFKKSVNFSAMPTASGGRLRATFFFFSLAPLFYACDQNGGFFTLGFTSTTMERHYKFRPDYMTGKLFAAQRAEVPTFRNM
jgi:hypothetical protein